MEPALKMDEDVLLTARALVAALEAGNSGEAGRLLGELTRVHESVVFQEMGRLTRQLHDALTRFELDGRLFDLTHQEIPEAKERLAYVVEMTEQAANQTLGAVEATLPVSSSLREQASELGSVWERFGRRELDATQLKDLRCAVGAFLARVAQDGATIHANLSEILMAQGFQDLTGQVLRRVTALVQEVEDSLVNIIRLSATAPEKGIAAALAVPRIEPSGPAIRPAAGDVMANQDDVDALLSSLGF